VAVALDSYPGPGCPYHHQLEFANDGYYGNGSSWISNSTYSWLKIDLGRVVLTDSIRIGRDRNGYWNDREPGQFTVAVALAENAYANGDDSNDANEYVEVFDSADFGFSGIINGPETVQASFPPVPARFIKLTVQNAGAAIDEVEVLGSVGNIDIKPGSCPNPLNPRSKGVLPAAILGTMDFDVHDIDPMTLVLEDAIEPIWTAYEDVTTPVAADAGECECTEEGPDGYMDLTMKFRTVDVVDALGSLEPGAVIPLTISGSLLDGTPFFGVDCMVVVGRGSWMLPERARPRGRQVDRPESEENLHSEDN
jgi:hypothetical protein